MRARGLTLLSGVLALALPAAAPADEEAISVLAETCAACHGTDGYPPAGVMPTIGGRPAAVLASDLREFRGAEHGPRATVMGRLAASLTDEQIEQLARYFAARERP
jgi:cytochrome subunit of sulfide dehydrogenase